MPIIPAGGGHVIQDEATPLPPRPVLNFTGSGVSATDDAANGRTNVTITGTAGGPFGPSDIADRTRSIWRGPQDFILCTGTPAQAILGTILWPYWALDATASESIVTTIEIPRDYVAGTSLTVKVFYFVPTTTAGNIVLRVLGRPVGNANALDLDGYPAAPGATCAAPGVANQMAVVTISSAVFAGGVAVAGEAAQIQLLRNAGDAADTYASDVHIAGLMFEYTADM